MSFFSKLGRGLRSFGEKLTHGAQLIGNKVGNFLLSASPVLSVINPALGAAAAGAGGVAKGIGALAGVAEGALKGRGVDFSGARAAMTDVGNHTRAVREAYSVGRNKIRSALERK